ncbi:hypothetical protein [Halomicrobium urmianum]|nr:hypothetical protein [Halomicrobium urmianum]
MTVPASLRSLPPTVAVALAVVAALCMDLLFAVYAESQAAAALGWPLIML